MPPDIPNITPRNRVSIIAAQSFRKVCESCDVRSTENKLPLFTLSLYLDFAPRSSLYLVQVWDAHPVNSADFLCALFVRRACGRGSTTSRSTCREQRRGRCVGRCLDSPHNHNPNPRPCLTTSKCCHPSDAFSATWHCH